MIGFAVYDAYYSFIIIYFAIFWGLTITITSLKPTLTSTGILIASVTVTAVSALLTAYIICFWFMKRQRRWFNLREYTRIYWGSVISVIVISYLIDVLTHDMNFKHMISPVYILCVILFTHLGFWWTISIIYKRKNSIS